MTTATIEEPKGTQEMILNCKDHNPLHKIAFNNSAKDHDDFPYRQHVLKEGGIIDLYNDDFVVLSCAAKDGQHMNPDNKVLILIEDETEDSELESNAELKRTQTGIYQSCRKQHLHNLVLPISDQNI